MPKQLRTLGENNREALKASRGGGEEEPPRPNGVACPLCGEELSDSYKGVIPGSHPPNVATYCVKCGWSGNRYVVLEEGKDKRE